MIDSSMSTPEVTWAVNSARSITSGPPKRSATVVTAALASATDVPGAAVTTTRRSTSWTPWSPHTVRGTR
jgi:hypothetical protein